ncbi:twin-arginine translocase TatA/TatE family subunit [Desulfomarina sp.]
MFGIGLPEMILILALALIVVGPDKLPDLARSVAKGIMELKKTAEGLKESFTEEGNPLEDIRPDLEEAARSLKNNLLDPTSYDQNDNDHFPGVNPPAEEAATAYKELMGKTDPTPSVDTENSDIEKTENGTGDPVIDIQVTEENVTKNE